MTCKRASSTTMTNFSLHSSQKIMNFDSLVISNIVSFVDKPVYMKRVSHEWLNVIECSVTEAIERLTLKYPGRMRDIDDEIYSTLYTSMREAIRANDLADIAIIASSSGYLPIPWDLLAYDVSFHGGYEALACRFSPYGHVIHELITVGFNEDSKYPIYLYKPFSTCGEEWGSQVEFVSDIVNLGKIRASGKYGNGYYLDTAGLPILNRDDVTNIVGRNRLLPHLYMYDDSLPEYTIAAIGTDDRLDLYEHIHSRDRRTYGSHKQVDVSFYPHVPPDLDLDTIILLDRVDLFDQIAYQDIINMIQKDGMIPGRYIAEYIQRQ